MKPQQSDLEYPPPQNFLIAFLKWATLVVAGGPGPRAHPSSLASYARDIIHEHPALITVLRPFSVATTRFARGRRARAGRAVQVCSTASASAGVCVCLCVCVCVQSQPVRHDAHGEREEKDKRGREYNPSAQAGSGMARRI